MLVYGRNVLILLILIANKDIDTRAPLPKTCLAIRLEGGLSF
jgi:hypothetical protein